MNGTADVVVIGGGILGAASAFHLARAGHSVVLLERGTPNRAGSGTTAGNLHIQAIHPKRPDQLVPADRRRFVPLQLAASALWSTVEEDLGSTVELRRHGGLMVAETPDQAAELREKVAIESEFGMATELLSGDDARRELPQLGNRVLAADWCGLDGYANPLLMTPAYLAAAVRRGAVMHAQSPVTGLVRRTTGFTVCSPHGQWTTPWVVNAAGPWIAGVAQLAGVRLDMAPVAIQMHATVRIPPIMRLLVQHVAEGLSVKQVSAGQILIGGGWPAARLDLRGRSAVSAASMASNLSQACRILPFLRDLRLLRTWAGPLAATPDEMPVIGEVPGCPGMLIVGGTYAFTLAPLWGETVHALVEGRTPQVPVADLSPGRLLRNERPPEPAPIEAP